MPYPGLARFTAANRDLLVGRDQDKNNLVQCIRAGHSRILLVGPSGAIRPYGEPATRLPPM